MTAAEILTTIISSIALLAALFSVIWPVVRSRWEKPVVVVTGGDGTWQAHPEAAQWMCRIDVVNVGERAVTVTGVGWYTLLEGDTKRGHVVQPDTGSKGPDLPYRLDAHDFASWTIYRALASSSPSDAKVPWATVVQRRSRRQLRIGVRAEEEVRGDGNKMRVPFIP